MLKSTNTTQLLFRSTISPHWNIPLPKAFEQAHFWPVKEESGAANVLPCSEEKIHLFNHSCSSNHFLDKHNYYSLRGRSLSQNPLNLCCCLSSGTNAGWLKFRGELVPFSGSLCIIFFLLSSQVVLIMHKSDTQMFL